MKTPFETLLPRMHELRDLDGIIQLLSWDQETYLPPGAMAARGGQLSTLQGLYHERLVHPRVGELIAEASADTGLKPDAQAMVRELARERNRAVKIPERLVRELADAQAESVAVWRSAREHNRYSDFEPALRRLLKLRQEEADATASGGERYDAMLDRFEPDMTVGRLGPVLAAVAKALVPMVTTLTEASRSVRRTWEGQRFQTDIQWALSLELLEAMGFDSRTGRQDRSIHPFSTGIHPSDVRVTTRLDELDPLSALFSTLHEGGHGLYEQGFDPVLARTPLARGASMGLHESQSRLWENQVGRSLAFWRYFFPRLRQRFPCFEGADLESFHRAINAVSPSLIRTEADEVTYNLHIVLRFELELALARGDLDVADLPGAWYDRLHQLLGLRPKNDVEGVLQDIHWSMGELGYFPTYTLGNLYSASLFEAARRSLPSLDELLARGELRPLRDWLRDAIHRHGARTSAEERVRQVTGEGLTDTAFLRYLKEKYPALYDVALP